MKQLLFVISLCAGPHLYTAQTTAEPTDTEQSKLGDSFVLVPEESDELVAVTVVPTQTDTVTSNLDDDFVLAEEKISTTSMRLTHALKESSLKKKNQ